MTGTVYANLSDSRRVGQYGCLAGSRNRNPDLQDSEIVGLKDQLFTVRLKDLGPQVKHAHVTLNVVKPAKAWVSFNQVCQIKVSGHCKAVVGRINMGNVMGIHHIKVSRTI